MIICFDIGGTAIKGAVAYSADDICPFPRQPTPLHDFDAFVATLAAVITEAETEAGKRPDCVALSIAGVIDPDTAKAVVANIPCVHGRLLQADLEQALGLPVVIANDADCFVLAEAGIGAARGHRVVFGIILGTGVGGGLVIDGKLINSAGGFAGEWGHGPVQANEAGTPPVRVPRFQCGCGQVGCIDAVCSARGLEKLHRELHGETRTSEEILADWQNGDATAIRTLDVYIDILADALSLVVNVTGTTILPVGGGLSNVPALISAIDVALRRRILRKFAHPIVVPATCRVEPGLIGAAILGLGFAAEHRES
ncbi:N-acetylglucosamine kinase [Rhizobium sp. Root274]|uniref:ROK family protein n=1 Tax=unclassified Rhizobium TaxID=2613769 RepID=UPI0007162184|nr:MULTISPECIES: ROK family protein [unclassified Rhizobium]KQW29572.1 N-acetylglucosamine kinase [Rhizobium sp. Root1240]KRD29764.1 N-acetylglucosamine kinase [Rhizobium sp. Root274]